jgi:hypothetical protein
VELERRVSTMKARQRMILTTVFLMALGLNLNCRTRLHEEQSVIQRPGSAPLTGKQAYPIARGWAQRWRGNAYLEEVIMVIPGNQVESGPREIAYSFIADRALGPFRWWDSALITVDAYVGKIIKVETLWGATHHQRKGPFDIEATVLDSSDALRMAEGLGGKAYREKWPNAQVRIMGTHGLMPGELFWDVGYFRPPEVRGDELSFGIEARTGDVRGDVYLPPSLPK